MATKIIPIIPGKNQIFMCTLPVDDRNITLGFTFTWNGQGQYWFISVTDTRSKQLLIDAVPLVTGKYPAADILGQYTYLGIGSAAVVPVSVTVEGIPTIDNLGTDFVLVWTDTVR
ncbi:phage baseplate plug family protein [Paenibacillus ginsengarvi]|uniref:Cyanophage baseplate Pam3 plug gp18 domain-containing protein n=1 Tax=Paenibacillus ginsengarvi TaxID=400777 RepID=A0A3B0BTN5_9BACL|nr:hypothetical protein [Paenibacillus ginsengarvi]RKN74996.1 hypothetical protein D7M11_26020 [Paenibacillus ginsengarvi]